MEIRTIEEFDFFAKNRPIKNVFYDVFKNPMHLTYKHMTDFLFEHFQTNYNADGALNHLIDCNFGLLDFVATDKIKQVVIDLLQFNKKLCFHRVFRLLQCKNAILYKDILYEVILQYFETEPTMQNQIPSIFGFVSTKDVYKYKNIRRQVAARV
jgi:hypothetical protein